MFNGIKYERGMGLTPESTEVTGPSKYIYMYIAAAPTKIKHDNPTILLIMMVNYGS